MKIAILCSIIILLSMITGCISSGISMYDHGIFMESPKIVTQNNRYFIRFRYAEDAFFLITYSTIENEELIFYLPTTSSSAPRGKLGFEEIVNKEKIDLIKKKAVYWREPDGKLVPLNVETMKESIDNLPSHLRKH